MRITGGQKKGKRVKVSKRGIRPTKGVVREAIFNIISSRIHNAKVLDIFAGSGALGLEAISRGAQNCVFIEKNPKILLKNIDNFSVDDKTRVIMNDYQKGLRKIKGKRFDIIFIDPPYHKNYIEKTIHLIARYRLLNSRGLIIAEHYVKEEFSLPDSLSILKEKQYGETIVKFMVEKNNNAERAE
jgi:16S rRNA (guanine966-N2)-methyltransferase